jgi:CTP synthase (UTP-ammonia lyase)
MQKLDPYINVDPGTMSPYQHGEVYVLDDGSETDLDLGHYERFTNSPADARLELHHRQIYLSVIEKERRGEFLGKTVQVIPHITNEIKACIQKLADPTSTWSSPRSAARSATSRASRFWRRSASSPLDVGKENCLYIHLTLVPYLKAAGELKTKPTQHSVGQLRQIGIQPDILICRTERPISRDDREKIALFCNVPIEAVIEEKDKDFSIYEVPLSLVDNGWTSLIVEEAAACRPGELDLDDWRDCCTAAQSRARDQHRRRRQVRRAQGRLQVDLRGARPRRHHHSARSASAASKARRSNAKGPSGCWPATTASSCPAASASGASKARSKRSASPASGASRSSASAWACSAP